MSACTSRPNFQRASWVGALHQYKTLCLFFLWAFFAAVCFVRDWGDLSLGQAAYLCCCAVRQGKCIELCRCDAGKCPLERYRGRSRRVQPGLAGGHGPRPSSRAFASRFLPHAIVLHLSFLHWPHSESFSNNGVCFQGCFLGCGPPIWKSGQDPWTGKGLFVSPKLQLMFKVSTDVCFCRAGSHNSAGASDAS